MRLWFLLPLIAPILASGPVAASEKAQSLLKTITVSGSGEIKKIPDQVSLSVTLLGENRVLKEAKKTADDKLAALYQIISDLKIDKKDLATSSANIEPRYDDSGINRTFRDYEASYTVTITLRRIDLFATLIDRLLAAKIDRIDSVEYGLQHSEQVKIEALQQAFVDAREKAQMLAKTAGMQIDALIQVNEEGTEYHPVQFSFSNMSDDNNNVSTFRGAPPPPAPLPPPRLPSMPNGQVLVDANVEVTFVLKE